MDMITVVTVLTVLLDGLIVVILRPVLLFQAVVALMTTVEIAYHSIQEQLGVKQAIVVILFPLIVLFHINMTVLLDSVYVLQIKHGVLHLNHASMFLNVVKLSQIVVIALLLNLEQVGVLSLKHAIMFLLTALSIMTVKHSNVNVLLVGAGAMNIKLVSKYLNAVKQPMDVENVSL